MVTEEVKGKRIFFTVSSLIILAALAAHYLLSPWGYYWKVPAEEEKLRSWVIETARSYLGVNEADGSHQEIIDLYNSQEVLPVGYEVQSSDSWCATFVTAVALQQGLTAIIPPECGCERQIGLFQELGRWEEADDTIPLPGDIIYYDWDSTGFGDCTGWSDHVGIVVGTKWPLIKVIEGNKNDRVEYRTIFINDIHIRGFGKPDYAQMAKNIP